MTTVRTFLSLLVLLLVSLPSAQGATWTTIDAPGGTQGTLILAVNSNEDMTGIYVDDANVVHAFLLSGGSFFPINVPDAVVTWPSGINDAGQITGLFYKADEVPHGFFIDGMNVTTLDFPGAKYTYAQGINNAGEVVGIYVGEVGGSHGFKWSNGSFDTIDSVGQPLGLTGINNLGQIVGSRNDGNKISGFAINKNGGVRFFARSMYAMSLNDKKIVVGYVPFVQYGIRFNMNTKLYTKIKAPNSSATTCYGINNGGEIVGSYRGLVDGLGHGFLRTR